MLIARRYLSTFQADHYDVNIHAMVGYLLLLAGGVEGGILAWMHLEIERGNRYAANEAR